MAESGSVLFNFERKGLVYLKSGDEDAIFEAAIEAGADDVKENDEFSEDGYVVIAEYKCLDKDAPVAETFEEELRRG